MFGFYWTEIFGTGYYSRFFGANLRHAKIDSFTIFTAIPADLAAQHKNSARPTDALLPVDGYTQSGVYPEHAEGWNHKQYVITTYSVTKDFRFAGPIPPAIWQHSMYAALNSLASAKNLDEAEIPSGLRAFINANRAALSRTILSAPCH